MIAGSLRPDDPDSPLVPGHLVNMRWLNASDVWICPCCKHTLSGEGIWYAAVRP